MCNEQTYLQSFGKGKNEIDLNICSRTHHVDFTTYLNAFDRQNQVKKISLFILYVFLVPVCFFPQLTWSQWKNDHTIELGLMLSYRPSNKVHVDPSPNNPIMEYVYSHYKTYKYPGASYRYQWSTYKNEQWRFNLSAACYMRYLQKVSASNYITFYSFPLLLGIEKKLFKVFQVPYYAAMNLGYQFKHPKHQYLDGLGGMMGGFHLVRRKNSQLRYFKFGYEIIQQRLQFFVKASQLFPGGIDEKFSRWQYTHQFTASFGWQLHAHLSANPKKTE